MTDPRRRNQRSPDPEGRQRSFWSESADSLTLGFIMGEVKAGVIQEVLFPGYTGNRQSRASQGIPRFECNPDLNHAARIKLRRLYPAM